MIKKLSLFFFLAGLLFIQPATAQEKNFPNLEIKDQEEFQKKLSLFQKSAEENLKPTKWDYGGTTISNEDRLDIFQKHIENVGGGYVGVGSTQNFTLAAWAKAEWVWLMDFTRIVVAVNKIHITFLKKAENPKEFIDLWQWQNRVKAMQILKEEFKALPPYQSQFILGTWYKARPFFLNRQRVIQSVTKRVKYHTWLTDESLYQYMRKLALQGRIRALGGDLNGPTTFQTIAKTAQDMGIKIRVLYFSNAEEYFPFRPYRANFQNSIKSMPIDQSSQVIRTVSIFKWIYPWAPESHHSNDRGFHYNVMPLQSMASAFEKPEKTSVIEFLKYSAVDLKLGFSKYTGELNYWFGKKKPQPKPVKR